MIDRSGKVLTDYAFTPPARRWMGKLAVISRFGNIGLATAEGKVLVGPIFNAIKEFHDGVAIAFDSRERDKSGGTDMILSVINEQGEVLATGRYTEITDFDHGVAWASHRWTDPHSPTEQEEGWGLIDPTARELSELKYVRAHWISVKGERDKGNLSPAFHRNLAAVALAEGFQPTGQNVWFKNSWGYMNRSGKVVAWYEATNENAKANGSRRP